MNKEQFWNIVNEVHSSTDPRNQKEVLTALRDRLRNLPSEEILEWKQIFSFYQDAARRNDLWAASAAMGAHSSDDGFMDFRSWLISQGRDVYMSALKAPESLVSVNTDGQELNFEDYAYVPCKACAERRAYEEMSVGDILASYCRVSTKKDEQLNSYENQRDYYTEKIMANPNWTMADIFADEGITGTSACKRKDFLRMIRQCRKGKIDMILAKSVSRFARNTVDTLSYTRELRSMGIPVIFEEQNINSIYPESEFLITIHGAFAQSESEGISSRVKWGKHQAMRTGKANIQYKTLLGYEKGPDGEMVVNAEQAETVRKIYELYLSGQTLRNIKETLETGGFKNTAGTTEWTTSNLRTILSDEKYCGDVLLQKTFIRDCISKQVIRNTGQLPMYLIQNHHEATVMQEMLVRGYLYQMIKSNGSIAAAIIVSTGLFTFAHGGAFEAGILPVLNVITMSLFMTAVLEYTGSLIAPIVIHFLWNGVGAIILGGVSLAEDYPHLFDMTIHGNPILSGGSCKIEGSIIVLFMNLAFLIGFVAAKKRKDRNR